MKKRVAVFGGSLTDDLDYSQALALGRRLGQLGYTVLTGGYIGSMEAVSRGAAEHHAHIIGVTSDEIERWRPVKPNPWIKEEWRFPTVRERLYALVEKSDAAIALPGGAGTLTEIAFTWTQLITAALPPRLLILVGTGWERTFKTLFEQLGAYIPENQRSLLTFAQTVDQAVIQLERYFSIKSHTKFND